MGTPLDTIESSYGQEFGNPYTGWGDLLTCYDGNQLIGYDGVGNLVIMGIYTYSWKHGRQLKSISDGGTTWTFTYDANGMRKSRSNGSATYTYTYNGSKLMQMTRGTDVLDFYYDASGTPVAFKHNGTTYYYVTTLQGDILLILDADGEIVVSYDYDAWGKLLAIGGSMATTLGTLNPLTYRGYVYDHEYGLYYLQSRYYNPEWGRFLNADAFVSTGGLLGNNMFAYCGNNPVNREDPTGHAFVQVDYDFDGLPNALFPEVSGGCAGGYVMLAGGKYSKDEDVHDLYESFIEILSIDEVDDIAEAFIHASKNNIVKGVRPAVKIASGVRKVIKGIGFIVAPIPTLVEDVAGVTLVANGMIDITYGIAKSIAWIGEQE